MTTRKVLLFNTIVGFTIPKMYAEALELKRGDNVEIYLGTNKTLIVKKQRVIEQKLKESEIEHPTKEQHDNH